MIKVVKLCLVATALLGASILCAEQIEIPVGETRTYSAAAGQTLTISDALTGAGAVAVEGEGTVYFTAANTYTGGFTVKSGIAKGGPGAFGPTYSEEETGSRIEIAAGATLQATTLNHFGYRIVTAGTFCNLGGNPWTDQLISVTLSGDAVFEGGPTAIYAGNLPSTLNLAGHTLISRTTGEGFQLYGSTKNVTDEAGGKFVVESGALQIYGNATLHFETTDLVLAAGTKAQGFADAYLRGLSIAEGATFTCGRWNRTFVYGEYALAKKDGSIPYYIGFGPNTTFRFPADVMPGETLLLAQEGGVTYNGGKPQLEKVNFYIGEELIEEGNLTLDTNKRTIAYELPKGGKAFWSGAAGDGAWETAGNWASGAVPTDENEVCFMTAAEVTVTAASRAGALRVSAPITMILAGMPELGEIEVSADGELGLSAPEGETRTIDWAISGAGKVAAAGAGTLVFTQVDKTYTGGFAVKSGTAQGAAGSFGAAGSKVSVENGAILAITTIRNFGYPLEAAGTIRHLGGVVWSAAQITDLTLTGDATLEGGPLAIYQSDSVPATLTLNGYTLTSKLTGEGLQFYANTQVVQNNGGKLIVGENTKLCVYGDAKLNLDGIDLRVETGASSTCGGDVIVRSLYIGEGATFTCGVWSRTYVKGELAFATKDGSVPQYITLYPTTTFRFPADLAPEETMVVAKSGNINLENGGPQTTAIDFYVGDEQVERGTVLINPTERTIAFKYPNEAVWVGGNSCAWNDPANWKPALVPNAETIVHINGDSEIVVASDSSAGEVIIAKDAELTLAAPAETEVTVGILISGEGALAVGGEGIVKVTNAANSFEGGFTVKSGTAKGKAKVFGPSHSQVVIEAGATLELSGTNGAGYDITMAGTLRNLGSGQWESHFCGLKLTGDARIEGSYSSFTNSGADLPVDLAGHTLTVALNKGADLQFNRGRESNDLGGTINVITGGVALYGAAAHFEHLAVYLGDDCTFAAGDVDAFVGRLGVTGNGKISCNSHRFTFSEPIDAAIGTLIFARNTYITSNWVNPETGVKALAFYLGEGKHSGKVPYARVVANANSNVPSAMAKAVVFDAKQSKFAMRTQLNEAGDTEYFASRNGFSLIVR